jgi:ribonuclease MRP protein subunit RMP1
MIGGGGITQRRVKGANNEGAEKNIAFLRERVLPRCWVAFSGVVADNQYAALGLMLMAALGRLGRLLGLDVKAAEAVEAVDASGEVVQEEEMGRGLIGAVQVEEDLGVLLLREEVMRTEEAQNNEIEKKYTRPKSEAVLVETEKLPAKKRRMKKQLDAIDELFSGLI